MPHRIYLSALASDDELDLFLECSVVDPRIADVYRPVREISLLSVSARSEQSAQQIFAAARDAIDVVLGASQSLVTDWVSWTHTVPPVNDNFAACSVTLDGLDVVLPIGAWRAVRTTATVLAAAITPQTVRAVAALRNAKRAADSLFAVDAQMCYSLRRRGICYIDAFGWLFPH